MNSPEWLREFFLGRMINHIQNKQKCPGHHEDTQGRNHFINSRTRCSCPQNSRSVKTVSDSLFFPIEWVKVALRVANNALRNPSFKANASYAFVKRF